MVVSASPVELSGNAIDGARAPFAGSREQIMEDIRAYEAVGVTGMTVGFRARSLDDQLDKMERFAREIAPAFAG